MTSFIYNSHLILSIIMTINEFFYETYLQSRKKLRIYKHWRNRCSLCSIKFENKETQDLGSDVNDCMS
jgi:hypothetical protein